MKKTQRQGKSFLPTLMKTTMLGLALVCVSQSAMAQNQESENYVFFSPPFANYSSPWNLDEMKGYSVEVIPNGTNNTNNESVMAGTFYERSGSTVQNDFSHRPHYLKVSDSATVIISKRYLDPRFVYERSVDIELDNTAAYSYITCSSRPLNPLYTVFSGPPPTTYATAINRDGIKVLKIDNSNGTVAGEAIAFDQNNPSPQNYGNSLYPMHSMYSNRNGYERLYICGYRTPDDTRCDGCTGVVLQENFEVFSTNNKEAFITYLDLSNMQWGPIEYYNTTPTLGNNDKLDFDMALRMKEYGFDDILITGSVNSENGIYNNGIVRSGTMFLEVDDALTTIRSDASFITIGNQDGYGPHEYGMAIEPRERLDPAQLANRVYVLGNMYDYGNAIGEDPYIGFNQRPNQLYMALVNDFGTLSFFANRMESEFGNWWFTNTTNQSKKTSTTTTVGLNVHRILAAGFVSSDPSTCSLTDPATINNVNPFLLDIHITPLMTLASTPSMSLFENKSGTNRFNTLGSSMSNIYFHAPIADRDDSTTAVVMAAPKYSQPGYYDALGLKLMHAVGTPTDYNPNQYFDQGCGKTDCAISFESAFMESPIPVTRRQDQLLDDTPATFDEDFGFGSGGNCTYASGSIERYKQGNLSNISNKEVQGVYPNPVSDILHISNAEGAKFVVMDVTGRAISTGTLSSNNATINVQSLANGMYILHLTKGEVVNKVKFVKQ